MGDELTSVAKILESRATTAKRKWEEAAGRLDAVPTGRTKISFEDSRARLRSRSETAAWFEDPDGKVLCLEVL
jgi:hypothetical protein